jgi:UDP-N-acetylglucosamine acyltransferase
MNDLYNENWRFDPSNEIHPTAIIYDNVVMGKNNKIGAYAVIGGDGEIRDTIGEYKGRVVIGDNNIISELATIQRPYEKADTIIGDNNYIMVHSHIGHDVVVGNNVEICGHVVLLGYCKIEDNVRIKVAAIIRNRITIGKNANIGMGSIVTKSVEPNTTVIGNPAKPLIK